MISILLVDDEKASIEAAAEFFRKDAKFEVDTSGSANEAMEKLNVYSYDAVVSDFLMPGTNGLELWKWLRAIGDNTPFVVHADEGWEDLVSETLGDDDLQIYLRNGDNGRDMVRLQAIVEETIRRKSEKDASALLKLNYGRLLNSMQAGIVSIDTDGKIDYHNSHMAEMLGCAEEDIRGRMLASYSDEQGAEAISRCINDHAENLSGHIELTLTGKDSTHLNVKLSASPEYSDTGRYLGIMFIVTDLTLWKQETEAIIKEKEEIESEKQSIVREKDAIASDLECLREIVFKSSNAVLVIDGSGTVAFVNPAAEKLFDAESGQIEGERPGFPLIPDIPITAGIIGEQQTIIEMRLGDIEWGGQPAYLVTVRDVTSHFLSESELKKVRDDLYGKVEGRTAELIEANRTLLSEVGEKKQVLIAMNETSASMKSYRDLLALVCREIVHTNKTGVDNLGKLIEAFGFNKEMTRLLSAPLESFNESSKLAGEAIKYLRSQEPVVKPVDMTEAIAQVKLRYPASDRRIAILVQPSSLCQVEGNEMIEDALYNIVEDARDRSVPNRQLTVSIAMARVAGDDRDYCRCTLEDNSSGMPDNDKVSAFKFPEQRTNKGLGLFLSKSIIEGFNGKMWVEDRVPGDYTKGCRFVIILPTI